MEKIKIFVTYKNQESVIKSNIITPIQSGRAISPLIFNDMIGDDEGDNISEKNPIFSELSAVYWVWRNYQIAGNPDYVGFMHYRRHFIFNERLALPYPKWISSFYYFPSLFEALPYFTDEDITATVPHYDYLIPKYHVTPTINIREEYVRHIPGSRAHIFDSFIEICRELHPDWEEEIKRIESGNVVLICNMFIMKKELFFEYCNFAFPVLLELERRIDKKELTINGLRFCGYMAEKLLTMYTFRLEKKGTYKGKFLDCTYIRPDIKRNDVRINSKGSVSCDLCTKLEKESLPAILRRIIYNEEQIRLMTISNNLAYWKLKKIRYWFKSLFTRGEKREINRKKYEEIRMTLKKIPLRNKT